MTANITIRPILPQEVEHLQSIAITTFRAAFEAMNEAENVRIYLAQAYSLDSLRNGLTAPNSHSFWIQYNDEIIGYYKLNTEEVQSEQLGSDALEIQRIYLLEKAQGMGAGSSVMQIITDQCVQLERKYI